MKLLLDEQLPKSLVSLFPTGTFVSTVQSEGWGSTKNGALLKLAKESEFDAILTADKNVLDQQNENLLPLAVVVLSVYRLNHDSLAPLIPDALEHLTRSLTPRFVVVSG